MGNIKNKHPGCKQQYSVNDSPYYSFTQLSPPQCVLPTNQISSQSIAESDKDRNVFALLGFLIGSLGIHQFYIGNIGKGIVTILACCICSPVGLFIVGIEILSTTTDSKQCPLKDKDSPVAKGLGWLMILGGIVLFVVSFQHYLPIREK